MKDLNPSGDPGKFNLQINGNTDPDATNVGDGGSTGEQPLNTGTHNVGEIAGTSTDLANYQKSISCVDTANGNAAVASTSGDSAGPLDVTVTYDADIVCTITNTRETGKLEVVKDLNPSGDPGKFNLQINGTTDPDATNVGDGGSTGEQPLNTGTHNVGEIAGTSTDLANYQKSISCVDTANGNAAVASTSGDSAGPLDVTVTYGSDIVCTITNTRETGKLEVVKDLNPSGDPGKFNLQINGNTPPSGVAVGDGGTTGEQPLNTGTHNVGETAVIGTDLANYQKSIVCKGDDGTGSIVAQTASDSAGPLDVTVTDGSDIVCTITNTRETGKLEVVKDLNPSGDPGKFNLQINGNTDPDATNVGDGGSTGEEPLNTGTHNVGEIAGTSAPTWPTTRSRSAAWTRQRQRGRGLHVGDSAGPLDVTVTNERRHRLHDHQHP